jgi:hypothetical protein
LLSTVVIAPAILFLTKRDALHHPDRIASAVPDVRGAGSDRWHHRRLPRLPLRRAVSRKASGDIYSRRCRGDAGRCGGGLRTTARTGRRLAPAVGQAIADRLASGRLRPYVDGSRGSSTHRNRLAARGRTLTPALPGAAGFYELNGSLEKGEDPSRSRPHRRD